jgi:hypothetical protein
VLFWGSSVIRSFEHLGPTVPFDCMGGMDETSKQQRLHSLGYTFCMSRAQLARVISVGKTKYCITELKTIN